MSASPIEEEDRRFALVTKEVLMDDVLVRVDLVPLIRMDFSVGGYEFSVSRKQIDYIGEFFPYTQYDTVSIDGLRSQVHAYDSAGRELVQMHFKATEMPGYAEGAELGFYKTEEEACDALLSALTPLFSRLEYGPSSSQSTLFE